MNALTKAPMKPEDACTLLEKEPYHHQLEASVRRITEAQLFNMPLSYEWIEESRNALTRVLDKMDAKA